MSITHHVIWQCDEYVMLKFSIMEENITHSNQKPTQRYLHMTYERNIWQHNLTTPHATLSSSLMNKVHSNIPQFHLAFDRKNASSRLIQAGWYAFGQPLQIKQITTSQSTNMKKVVIFEAYFVALVSRNYSRSRARK